MSSPFPDSVIPPRVQTALQYLHFAQNARRPGCGPALSGDAPTADEDLTPEQARVERAALAVLGNYLTGEMDYGDVPPRSARPGDDDAPPVRAPLPEPK